ncbi:SDR family oxidoreductase [uncultured Zhongshania sp.]|jgi:NADP-dependent 3-hydroxy acid dehydrogenase YdfG|uniref:SDR family oxidoreductase n=1 Tax=uncultured Zhongshania sp. TaxID=1642288 RepID=UPI0025E10A0F|nr:SDR family oxidoreductase [uncultured Zhongshania sp.]
MSDFHHPIAGHVYAVTGASSGYGLAIVQAIVAAGAVVGLIARGQENLDLALATIGSENGFIATADVSDSKEAGAALQKIHAHFGRLDGLVNNAGMARPGSIETYSDDEITSQLQLNIAAAMYCTRAAIPYLKNANNPRIVNISSASAEHHDEMQGLSLYAATKAALERLSRDTRREVQEYGIGVTILRPGAAMTEFVADWDMAKLKTAVDVWNERQGRWMDSGMEPGHVADALVYCLGVPPGVSVDLLEVRPNKLVEKFKF